MKNNFNSRYNGILTPQQGKRYAGRVLAPACVFSRLIKKSGTVCAILPAQK